MAERAALWQARAGVRWGLSHGLVRGLLTRAAREGDPQSRLIVDPAVRDDPYPVQEEVRARGPLVRGRLTWVTASHAVAKEVLRSPDFAAGPGESTLPPAARRLLRWAHDARALGPLDPPSMLVVEPPDHTRYRRLVSRVFTPRAVEQLRPQVQAVADELLDDLARTPAGQPVDLVAAYATLLPVRVICRILGRAGRPGGAGAGARQRRGAEPRPRARLAGVPAGAALAARVQRLARRAPAPAADRPGPATCSASSCTSRTRARGSTTPSSARRRACCWPPASRRRSTCSATARSCCSPRPTSWPSCRPSRGGGPTPWRRCCATSRRCR